MSAPDLREEPGTLTFDIIVPQPVFGGFDLVAIALGHPLSVLVAEALKPYLRADPYVVHPGGKPHDAIPVRLEGRVMVPVRLGKFGEMAVCSEDGVLVLLVPAQVGPMVQSAMQRYIAAGKARYLGVRPTPEGFVGSVAGFAIKPDPGLALAVKFLGVQFAIVFP